MAKAHRRLTILLVLIGVPLIAGTPAASEKEVAAPKVVKLKELIGAIKEQKGKVVVADFWADT